MLIHFTEPVLDSNLVTDYKASQYCALPYNWSIVSGAWQVLLEAYTRARLFVHYSDSRYTDASRGDLPLIRVRAVARN